MGCYMMQGRNQSAFAHRNHKGNPKSMEYVYIRDVISKRGKEKVNKMSLDGEYLTQKIRDTYFAIQVFSLHSIY